MKAKIAEFVGFASLIIALFATSQSAFAESMPFLKDTPIALFNEEDHALMQDNAEAVLSEAKTPAKRSWKNPKSGASGSAESLAAFSGPKGEPCKRVQIVNHAQGRTSKSNYTVCKMDAEGWKLVPSNYATPKK